MDSSKGIIQRTETKKMNSILKWLNENDIKYQHTNKGTDQYIKIVLEPNCTWFNGFGQEMVFAKYISIQFQRRNRSNNSCLSSQNFYGYNGCDC